MLALILLALKIAFVIVACFVTIIGFFALVALIITLIIIVFNRS